MSKKLYLAIALLITYSFCRPQGIPDDILHKKWDAFWIAVPQAPAHDYGVYHFRKVFSLPQKPSSFIIHVSADNRYKLYVNGTMIAWGPARGDLYNWNYETVDIAPFLQQGSNVMAAIVWNFGEEKQEAQISYQSAFILQGNAGPEKIVNTNSSWLCVKDTAYSALQPRLIYTYYAAGPAERIDYNQYPNQWTSPHYNDKGWKAAQELFNGLPKGAFFWTLGWMLTPRPIPFMEMTTQRLQKYSLLSGTGVPNEFLEGHHPFTIAAHSKVSVLIDQGFLTTAYPVLQFSDGKNGQITLSYAEGLYVIEDSKTDWRSQHQKGNRNETEGKRFVGVSDVLISAGNEDQMFTSLMWRTYRYIKLDIETEDDPITILDLYGLYEGYPFRLNADFKSDNDELQKILETGWRTARLCAHETYMDCPYYEQLQYVGDTRIQALVSLYNSGDDRLMRNAIRQIRNSLMPEGITMSRYPTAHSQQIPTFSLIWIAMVNDYWKYRGDSSFIREQLPVARMILEFFHHYQQKDGSLKNVPYWNFTDWVNDKGWNAGMAPFSKDGTSAAMDLQLLMAYEAAEILEAQVGLHSFANTYSGSIAQLKKIIRATYWDKERQLFGDTKERQTFSQHCNSLAILSGVIDGKEAATVAKKMIKDTGISKASVYFRYYLHQALSKAGLGDLYLDMLGKWKENLAMGMTTWAEIDDVSGARSDCHAWGSSPNIELFRIVLGIDSDGPGFGRVRIEPHLNHLQKLSGHIPHPKGSISTSYEMLSNGVLHVHIELPTAVTGTFVWKGRIYRIRGGNNSFDISPVSGVKP